METRHRENKQRHDHLQNSLDRLELAVAGIQDSASFRRYLDVQARFHRYSPNTVLLIELCGIRCQAPGLALVLNPLTGGHFAAEHR